MNKKGATDIGSGPVWIVVLIIVFFAMIIFFIVVVFTPTSSSVDIYKEIQDNGIVQYEMLNALMKSESDGKNFKEELENIYTTDYSKIDKDMQLKINIQASSFASKIVDLLSKRGRGCYLFLVNTNNVFDKEIRGAFEINNKLIIREVFYFLRNNQIRHLTSSTQAIDSNFNNPNPSQVIDKAAYLYIKNKPVYFYVSHCGEDVH